MIELETLEKIIAANRHALARFFREIECIAKMFQYVCWRRAVPSTIAKVAAGG
jgi:hypothetical protein